MKRLISSTVAALGLALSTVAPVMAQRPSHLCQIHSPNLETVMYAVTADGQFQFSICMDESGQTYYSSFGNMRAGMKDGIFLKTFYANLHDMKFQARNGIYVYTVTADGFREGYDYRLRVSKNVRYILNKLASAEY